MCVRTGSFSKADKLSSLSAIVLRASSSASRVCTRGSRKSCDEGILSPKMLATFSASLLDGASTKAERSSK